MYLFSSHWGYFINISWGTIKAIAFHYEKARGFPDGTSGKEPTCQCRRHKEIRVRSLGRKDTLEEGTATHFSILAWKIPWKEESGRLQSMVLQRVGHDWSNLACIHMRRQRPSEQVPFLQYYLLINLEMSSNLFSCHIYIWQENICMKQI